MDPEEGQTILVDILHVRCTADRRAITIRRVVVATVELIQNQRRAIPTNILDARQLLIGDEVTRGVTGVGGENDGGSTSDLLGDLVGVNVIVVVFGEGHRDRSDLNRQFSQPLIVGRTPSLSLQISTHILEQTQHLRISRIIRNRKRQVRIAQDSSNANQPRATTRHNAHILPRILARLALAIVLIVEMGDRRAQRLDTGGRAVLARGRSDRDTGRTREAALDLVVGFGGTLAEISPSSGVLEVTVFGSAFGTPDDAGGGTRSVKAGVGAVAFVGGTELTVGFRAKFFKLQLDSTDNNHHQILKEGK